MATITKTIQTAPITLQEISTGSVILSSAVDVSTKLAAVFHIHFGRLAETALTAPVIFRIEASAHASADGQWYPVAQYATDTVAAASEAASGTVSAGQAVYGMASTTGFAVRDIVYMDNGTVANSEWGRVKTVTANTSVTLEDNLINAQTGSTMYNKAEMFSAAVDLTGIKRMRVVVDNQSGQTIAAEVTLVTGDSIG